MSEEQQKEQSKDKKDDEVLIDFSTLGSKLKNWWKKEGKTAEQHQSQQEHHHLAHSGHHSQAQHHSPPDHHQEKKKPDDEIYLDWNKIKAAWNTHSRWLIPLICILIAMTASIYLRTMPLRLPVADDWAQRTVDNYYQEQLQQQIQQQYPNLPEQNQKTLVEKEWQQFQEQNRAQLDSQRQELSQQYKNQFRDDQGITYLLGIDPYYYYRQTGLILKNGFPGTEIRDGKPWDSYRLAPVGREQEWNFHIVSGAVIHWIINLFRDAPLMQTFFFVGTFFSALTVIPAFFIGRILTRNNSGGFFTALLMAVSSFFVARTTGESSDTDVHAVFFPVLITWLFLEALEAEELKKKMLWITLAGLATGLFAFAWTGWWYSAVFILATLIMQLAVNVLQRLSLRPTLSLLGSYIVSTVLFVGLFTSWHQFIRIVLGPFQFIRLKAVAVTTYWPNIRTTVAELNVPSFEHVINQFDGNLYFSLAILGLILLLFRSWNTNTEKGEKKEQGILRRLDLPLFFFFAIWFASAFWATTKGVRFVLQLAPAFSIGLGAFLGIAWRSASRWLNKELHLPQRATAIVAFFLLALFLITPFKSGYSQAFNSVPSVNDGWYNALTKIKMEAPENIIITSWWDFGHWFKAIADRPVTFDGGTQVGYGAHWVGKALLTPDERVTVGIVRMLNCGQNRAFEELDTIFQDTIKEIELLNQIILQSRTEATITLENAGLASEQAEKVLTYTHCAAPTDYFITSEDMVGKAGVWGHFGSWDFRKAAMYQKAKNLNRAEATTYLTETYNFTVEKAEQLYGEIQTTEADKWIAPWPGYITGFQPCERSTSTERRCLGSISGTDFILRLDLATMNATVENTPGVAPNALVYATNESIEEKTFSGKTGGFSVLLIPRGEDDVTILADPLQAPSVFARLFFLDGRGMKCFRKFSETSASGTGKILTWVVDYGCLG